MHSMYTHTDRTDAQAIEFKYSARTEFLNIGNFHVFFHTSVSNFATLLAKFGKFLSTI